MEDFILCVICNLMAHDVKCHKTMVAGKPIWVFTFEDRFTMAFDEDDINVVRQIYEKHKYVLNAENIKKYQHFISLCQ